MPQASPFSFFFSWKTNINTNTRGLLTKYMQLCVLFKAFKHLGFSISLLSTFLQHTDEQCGSNIIFFILGHWFSYDWNSVRYYKG